MLVVLYCPVVREKLRAILILVFSFAEGLEAALKASDSLGVKVLWKLFCFIWNNSVYVG